MQKNALTVESVPLFALWALLSLQHDFIPHYSWLAQLLSLLPDKSEAWWIKRASQNPKAIALLLQEGIGLCIYFTHFDRSWKSRSFILQDDRSGGHSFFRTTNLAGHSFFSM